MIPWVTEGPKILHFYAVPGDVNATGPRVPLEKQGIPLHHVARNWASILERNPI